MILWEIARASGLVAVALLTVVTVWGALVAGRTFRPAAPQVDLHRLLSTITLLLVVTHVASLVADRYAKVPFQAVFGIDSRPGIMVGAAALWLLVALPVSFRLLKARKMSRKAWRTLHWSGYGLWAMAVVHGLMQGSDSRSLGAVALYAGCAGLVAGAAWWRSSSQPAKRPARAAAAPGD